MAARRAQQTLLREGIDLALQYFDHRMKDNEAKQLIRRAKSWSHRYAKIAVGGPVKPYLNSLVKNSVKWPALYANYTKSRETALARLFPDVFNYAVDPPLRLRRGPNAGNGNNNNNNNNNGDEEEEREPFPLFVEPLMLTDAELDEVLGLRTRKPRGGAQMRVDAAALREAGLLYVLPEFLAQLGEQTLKKRKAFIAAAAAAPAAVSGNRGEEEAVAQQPAAGHASGPSRRRTRSGVVSASRSGSRPVLSPITQVDPIRRARKRRHSEVEGGNEGDEGDEDLSPRHNKVRLTLPPVPPSARYHYDMAERRLMRESPPPHDLGPDPWLLLHEERRALGFSTRRDAAFGLEQINEEA